MEQLSALSPRPFNFPSGEMEVGGDLSRYASLNTWRFAETWPGVLHPRPYPVNGVTRVPVGGGIGSCGGFCDRFCQPRGALAPYYRKKHHIICLFGCFPNGHDIGLYISDPANNLLELSFLEECGVGHQVLYHTKARGVSRIVNDIVNDIAFNLGYLNFKSSARIIRYI
jgi:hypothetical protein